jgi:type II secretory pathway pseudopilin PulG
MIIHKLIENKISRMIHEQIGTSLVEMLVAISLLGVFAGTFIPALSTGTLAVSQHDSSVIAQSLAKTEIEVIKAASYDEDGSSYSIIDTPEGYSITLDVESDVYSTDDIQKITVSVIYLGNSILVLEDYKVRR